MSKPTRRPYRWPKHLKGQQSLWYGCDYNPDQWPEDTWDEDIRLMTKAGVNVVALAVFSWSRIEPSQGVFDFDWLDRIIDKLGRAGIGVNLASATASPPLWLTQAHPEVLLRDERGDTVWPGARQHWRPTSPIFRSYALKLCRAMAEHYRDNPYLVAWHVGNEYGCHNRFDYSDDAMRAFQRWCRRRYKDIEAVNRAWGTDFWSQRLSDFSQDHLEELAYSSSLVDAIARRRPWWLMEQATSAVNWRPINPRKEPGQLERDSLAHLALGADAICYFQWRQSRAGAEKFHSAMLPHAGEDTAVFRDVCQLGEDLQGLSQAGLAGSTLARAPLALVFDYESQWASSHTASPSDRVEHGQEPPVWYRAFLDNAIRPDVLPVRAAWEEYPLVVLPALYLIDADLSKRLHKYVDGGGRLIVTWGSGIADEQDRVWTGGYPGPLRDLLGLSVEEFAPMASGMPGLLNHLNLTNGVTARDWADVIGSLDKSTKVLASYQADPWTGMDGMPAMTVHAWGHGKAVYLGCRLDAQDLAKVIPSLLEALDVADMRSAQADPGLLRIERVSGDGRTRFAFLFNRTKHPVQVQLEGQVLVGSLAGVDVDGKQASLQVNGALVQRVVAHRH